MDSKKKDKKELKLKDQEWGRRPKRTLGLDWKKENRGD